MNKLLVTLILLSSPLKADQVSVIFGGSSYHLNDRKVDITKDCNYSPCQSETINYDYNSNHNLIGIKYNDIILSKFNNSFYRESVLLAYDFELIQVDRSFLSMDYKLSLIAGLVTGYKGETRTRINDQLSFYISPNLETRYPINSELSISLNTSIIGSFDVVINSLSINYNF